MMGGDLLGGYGHPGMQVEQLRGHTPLAISRTFQRPLALFVGRERGPIDRDLDECLAAVLTFGAIGDPNSTIAGAIAVRRDGLNIPRPMALRVRVSSRGFLRTRWARVTGGARGFSRRSSS
jgi:hypothetical protein